MKERPILFSAPMVRALLAGTKTQTRRICKIQYGDMTAEQRLAQANFDPAYKCPHGVRGDRLWVREEHYRFGHWEPVPGVRTKGGRQKWKFVAETPEVRYNDNAPEAFRKGRHHETPDYRSWHKRLARFMPRAASRITLELTAVRVERLQDISEADAAAEGVSPANGALGEDFISVGAWAHGLGSWPKARYADLWTRINGPGSWAENPWVWCVSFRRVEGGAS